MIKISIIARPLFPLAAALLAAPLAAQDPLTITGMPVIQESVSYADLDLRERHARTVLVRRVMRASTNVCIRFEGRINIDKVMGGAENTCPNRTYRAAQPRIRTAIDRAKSGRPAIATSLVVSAPRGR